jgi:hypothetical protein
MAYILRFASCNAVSCSLRRYPFFAMIAVISGGLCLHSLYRQTPKLRLSRLNTDIFDLHKVCMIKSLNQLLLLINIPLQVTDSLIHVALLVNSVVNRNL